MPGMPGWPPWFTQFSAYLYLYIAGWRILWFMCTALCASTSDMILPSKSLAPNRFSKMSLVRLRFSFFVFSLRLTISSSVTALERSRRSLSIFS